ncbi:MAG: TetR/AcrR family transcriptional regulator [Cytophagaceae bacterium]|nr:TetR/AcrR family transcriptional regulator [Cytophagaceae bacterium]
MARPREFDEQEVLQKATEVFWKKGFHGSSMQDLVEAMDINRASLYDTFGNKQHLYLSCLKSYHDINQHELAGVVEGSGSARDRLRGLFILCIERFVDDPDRKGCFIANATLERVPGDPATQQLVCKTVQETEQLFRVIVEAGQQTGEINPALSPKELAQFWTTMLAGLRVVVKINPDRAALEDLMRVAMRVLD